MDQQQKALRARQLLEDPVLTESLEAARESFFDEWMAAGKVEDREAAWAKVHALAEVLSHLFFLASQEETEVEDDEDDSIPDLQ